eukprot:3681424-Amphidinium_carterae.1
MHAAVNVSLQVVAFVASEKASKRDAFLEFETTMVVSGSWREYRRSYCLLLVVKDQCVKVVCASATAHQHLNVYDSSLPIGERMRGKTVTVVNRSEVQDICNTTIKE